MTHPHKDLIIKLLDDPTLEVEQFTDCWRKCRFDSQRQAIAFIVQRPNYQFRIKEKPKPDVVAVGLAYKSLGTGYVFTENHTGAPNLRLNFTDDGTLKNAEVI